LNVRTIVLPRQAQDKHLGIKRTREKTGGCDLCLFFAGSQPRGEGGVLGRDGVRMGPRPGAERYAPQTRQKAAVPSLSWQMIVLFVSSENSKSSAVSN
jgi:hypothetical protein